MSQVSYSATKYSAKGTEVEKVEKPVPEAPTGSEIIVKNYATATNPVDNKRLTNWGNPEAKVDGGSLTVGWDAAGVVTAAGPDALFKVGDEVFYAGSLVATSSFQEQTKVDSRIVGRKPKNLSWTEAATVPLTYLTAWEGLVEAQRVSQNAADNAGKTLLVVNGAGGVGSFVIQIGKLFGLTVVATASRPETTAWVKKLGADHVINHHEAFAPQIEAAGVSGTIDHVFVNVDVNQAYDEVASVINPNGQVTTITFGDMTKIDWSKFFYKRVSLHFEFMFSRSMFGASPEKQGQVLNKAAELIDAGSIAHTKQQEFAFADLQKALEAQASGKTIGKIGVKIL